MIATLKDRVAKLRELSPLWEMHKEGIDQFKGADNDTVSVTVEGVLPFREYASREEWAEELGRRLDDSRRNRAHMEAILTGMFEGVVLVDRAGASDQQALYFDRIIDGYARLADEARAPLVGGNIARSPGPLMIDVTVIGSVRPRRVLLRRGAREGHCE